VSRTSKGGQCRRRAAQVSAARRGRARAVLLAAALCFFSTGSAWAQHRSYNLPVSVPATEVPQLEEQRRALLQKILANPADVDTGVAYAVLSTRLGGSAEAVDIAIGTG
jgi:hypothetical protein